MSDADADADRAAELAHLEAGAKHARDKLALYRAKAYSGRPTSDVRMRELQVAADLSAERLATARRRLST